MITLLIKPLSTNRTHRVAKGKLRISQAYKVYKTALLWLLPKNLTIYPKMEISILWGFTNESSDVDNPAKPFIDVLQKKYNFNDKNVFKLNLEKVIVAEPFIKFEIKEYK